MIERNDGRMSSLLWRRVFFVSIVLVIFLFSTVDADAQFRRGRYVLTGYLDWGYDSYSFEDDDGTLERTRFSQSYNLNLSGNIIDPRLVTFNTGLTYRLSNSDVNTGGTSSASVTPKDESLGYNVSFSFFPAFWFPFTLYTNRVTTDTLTRVYPDKTLTLSSATTTDYGGTLLLKFTTLPVADMYYKVTNTETENPNYPSELETTNYGVTLSKRFERLWGSYINGGYISTNTDDITAKAKTVNNVYYLTESSQISKTTSLSMNALLNDYTSRGEGADGEIDSQYMSARVGLSMQPSRRFGHSYSYDYSSSKSSSTTGSDSDATTNSLSGDAFYYILRRWPVNGRFRYSMTDNSEKSNTDTTAKSTDILDTAINTTFSMYKNWSASSGLAYYTEDSSGTSVSSTDRLDTAAGASWQINKNLSAGAGLAYSTEDASASGEDSSSKSMAGTANIGYATRIRFLDFRAGYAVAYSSTSSSAGEDSDNISHAFSAGAGSSYTGRYTSLSGDYGLTYTTSSTGEDGITHNISLGISNSYLTRTTISASTNWYFGESKTITSSSTGNTRSAALKLSSSYFTKTPISASADYTETHVKAGQISTSTQEVGLRTTEFLGAVATTSSDTKKLTAKASVERHFGRFGRLSLSAGYLKREETGGEVSSGYTNTSTQADLAATHTMLFTRRLSSATSVNLTDLTTETYGEFESSTTTTASFALNYSIGKWTASATYKYSLIDRQTDGDEPYESTEQTFTVGVRRVFGLFL